MSSRGIALRLSEVEVVYPGAKALAGVDLVVRAGERVALIGPSGAGKSTLLGLCNGTVAPTRGRVEVLGDDLAMADRARARAIGARVGTVYQRLHLVGQLRVIHNVNAGRLGSWSRRRALWSLIRPVGTEEAGAALAKMGVGHKLYERTDRLSGGEQQRVALARVLVQDPELVLADEPVSSLDPARAREVMGLLGVLAEGGRTLVVSLHTFGLAREYCDRVIGMRGGKVAFDRPAADVDDDLAARLYQID